MNRVHPHEHARGAALTETIVLMLVMLPLMFAVPMIGNLVDLRQTAVQGARYAAWEATVHGDAEAPAHLSERMFGDGKAPIVSTVSDGGVSALWGEGGGTTARAGLPADTRIEVKDASIATVPFTPIEAPGPVSGAVGSAIGAAGEALSDLGNGNWGIGETTLTRTGVAVKVEKNAWFDAAGPGCGTAAGCFTESAVILTDGWAADRTTAEGRVESLVPAGVLEPVGNFLSKLGGMPLLKELEGLDEAFGHVDMTPLPGESQRGRTSYGVRAYQE